MRLFLGTHSSWQCNGFARSGEDVCTAAHRDTDALPWTGEPIPLQSMQFWRSTKPILRGNIHNRPSVQICESLVMFLNLAQNRPSTFSSSVTDYGRCSCVTWVQPTSSLSNATVLKTSHSVQKHTLCTPTCTFSTNGCVAKSLNTVSAGFLLTSEIMGHLTFFASYLKGCIFCLTLYYSWHMCNGTYIIACIIGRSKYVFETTFDKFSSEFDELNN